MPRLLRSFGSALSLGKYRIKLSGRAQTARLWNRAEANHGGKRAS